MSEGPGGSAGRPGGFTPLNVISAPAPPAPEAEAPPDVNAEIAALGERVGQLIEGLSSNTDSQVGVQLDELLDAIDHLHREALTRLAGLLDHHDLLVHAVEDPVIGAALDLYELRPEGGAGDAPAGSPAGRTAGGGVPALIPLNAGLGAPAATSQAASRPVAVEPAAGAEPADVAYPRVVMPPPMGAPGAEPADVAYPRVTMPPPMGSGTSADVVTPGPVALPPIEPSTAAPRSMIGLNELEFGRSSTASRQAVPVSAPPMTAAYRAPALPDKDEPAEWFSVGPVDDIAPGTVFSPDEGALVFTNVDGEIRAFRNGCGNGPLALHMGRVIDGRRLVCPWHIGCVYDMASGISGDPPDQRRLIRYPVRVSDGVVEVAFNKGAVPEAPGTAPSATG